ncbi:hypothetical protein ESCOCK373B_22545 [Escherichia coli]
MNTNKGGLIIPFKGRTCGPVSFITNDEIKCRKTQFLRLMDDLNRVVGRKHHVHIRRLITAEDIRLIKRFDEAVRIRGRRIFQVADTNNDIVIMVFLTHITVRADSKTAQVYQRILCPFIQRLTQQCQTGHKEQYGFPPSGNRFSDTQRGEGFPCAARHNKLAAVGSRQPSFHGFKRGSLMRSELFFCFHHRFVGRIKIEL